MVWKACKLWDDLAHTRPPCSPPRPVQRIVDRVEGMQAVRSKLKKQELDQQSNVALLRMIELLDARFKDLDSRREQDNKVCGRDKCGNGGGTLVCKATSRVGMKPKFWGAEK